MFPPGLSSRSLPLWLVTAASLFPSHQQALWPDLPEILYLLPHGPLLMQRHWSGSWVAALWMGKTTAILNSAIPTEYFLWFDFIFLRACTTRSKIAKFGHEIIELAEFWKLFSLFFLVKSPMSVLAIICQILRPWMPLFKAIAIKRNYFLLHLEGSVLS